SATASASAAPLRSPSAPPSAAARSRPASASAWICNSLASLRRRAPAAMRGPFSFGLVNHAPVDHRHQRSRLPDRLRINAEDVLAPEDEIGEHVGRQCALGILLVFGVPRT